MSGAAYTAAVLVVWNLIVVTVYGWDKHQARRGGRRICERTLLLLAAGMGASGALLGMVLFRHKTRHASFTIGVPLLLILNGIVFNFAWHWILNSV